MPHQPPITEHKKCQHKTAHITSPKQASSQLTAHWSQFSFTFSAKERDTETGLSYFGSRYYSSDLSIWLSVDPQAAKYPGLSSFTYCANNPVKLVDPNGEEVVISGENAQEAFENLKKGTNFELQMDGSGNVKISGGKMKNFNDFKLYMAIKDSRVKTNIVASDQLPDGLGETSSGHCWGASYNKISGTATGTNFVNVKGLNAIEKQNGAPEGSGMMHEVTEAYGIGIQSLNTKSNLSPATQTIGILPNGNGQYSLPSADYGTYLYVHSQFAAPAPNEMSQKQKQSYKLSNGTFRLFQSFLNLPH